MYKSWLTELTAITVPWKVCAVNKSFLLLDNMPNVWPRRAAWTMVSASYPPVEIHRSQLERMDLFKVSNIFIP
jgi:hypothetical protein